MTINVTPIPKLTEFATPTITFGTAAAGTAKTVIRSDATIAGVGAQTSVDEAIARYNGTAGQLQGYTSLAPTISDAGIISLTSGALQFPATFITSSNVNTLDEYEEGLFVPSLMDNALDDDDGQGYSTRLGFYTRIGNRVLWSLTMVMTSLGNLTVGQQARIGGLPFVSQNTTSLYGSAFAGFGNDFNLSTAATGPLTGSIAPNTSYMALWEWDVTTGINSVLVSEFSADGTIYMSGQYQTAT